MASVHKAPPIKPRRENSIAYVHRKQQGHAGGTCEWHEGRDTRDERSWACKPRQNLQGFEWQNREFWQQRGSRMLFNAEAWQFWVVGKPHQCWGVVWRKNLSWGRGCKMVKKLQPGLSLCGKKSHRKPKEFPMILKPVNLTIKVNHPVGDWFDSYFYWTHYS